MSLFTDASQGIDKKWTTSLTAVSSKSKVKQFARSDIQHTHERMRNLCDCSHLKGITPPTAIGSNEAIVTRLMQFSKPVLTKYT